MDRNHSVNSNRINQEDINTGFIPKPPQKSRERFDGRAVSVNLEPRKLELISTENKHKHSTHRVGKPLSDNKIKKVENAIDTHLRGLSPKKTAFKGVLQYCTEGVAGVAAAVSTFIINALFGIAAGTLAGLLCGGPGGAIIGGVVGALLGGGAVIVPASQIAEAATDKVSEWFDKIKPPHETEWMKKVLGKKVIGLMLKDRVNAREIAIIEKAIIDAPTKLKKVLKQYKNKPAKKNYFLKGFESFEDAALIYLKKARERSFPGGRVIIDAWRKEPDREKADNELSNTIDFLIDSALKCEDRNSMAALRYLRDEISELYKGYGTGGEMIRSIDNCLSIIGDKMIRKMENCLAILGNIKPGPWEYMSPKQLESEFSRQYPRALESVERSFR